MWNESWMKRSDLPDGYDGWQAHDATPQEASEGVMKCGPAPVKAIKEGSVDLPYDARFIFAEVNGDRVHWLVRRDGRMEVLSKETNTVGLSISTKKVGSNWRDDVTSEYKHAEGLPSNSCPCSSSHIQSDCRFSSGSNEERKSVFRAFRHSSRKEHRVYDVEAPDVTFKLDCPDAVTLGEDFEIKVALQNQEDEARSVHVRLSAVASFYTGVTSQDVGVVDFVETLAPKEGFVCKALFCGLGIYEFFCAFRKDSLASGSGVGVRGTSAPGVARQCLPEGHG